MDAFLLTTPATPRPSLLVLTAGAFACVASRSRRAPGSGGVAATNDFARPHAAFAIVESAVAKGHGGTPAADSAAGEGTTFTLTLRDA